MPWRRRARVRCGHTDIHMLYRFKSKAAGDVIMLGATAEQVLRGLGREPAPKGILEVRDMPAALATLEAAIAADDAARALARGQAQASAAEPPPREGISLRRRAWPLMEMIKRARREEADITWGV